MAEAVRLQRYLSQCGVAARRKAEELIESGAVTVNGRRVTELGTKVVPGQDRVSVDGKPVYPEEPFYVLLNKPKGCLTAVSDPEGRPTVMEYLHKLPAHVAPVGRLDFYTEGVLLLTNDGELSARLQSPGHHVEKTYHVKIRDRLRSRHLEALRLGVRLDDGMVTRPAQVDLLGGTKSKHDWLVVTLIEGKSRQIHRMLQALGYQVMKLQRVAFAGLTFHGLRVGDARELTQVEVNGLRELVGLPKSTVSRGKWTSRREDTELARRTRARSRARQAAPTSEPWERPAREPARGAARAARDAAGPARGPGRGPARGASRGPGGPARGPARETRGPGGPSRGPRRETRGPGRPSRGPGRETRGPARETRGPGGPSRGPGRKPAGPSRGPGRETRGPGGPSRGPGRESRGSAGPARGPGRKPAGPSRGPARKPTGPGRKPAGPSRGPGRKPAGPGRKPAGPSRGPGRKPAGPARGPARKPTGASRGPGRGPGRKPAGPARGPAKPGRSKDGGRGSSRPSGPARGKPRKPRGGSR